MERRHRVLNQYRERVMLGTDDTLTLAMLPGWHETTPADLAQRINLRSLKALRARTRDENEWGKLDKAISIAESGE